MGRALVDRIILVVCLVVIYNLGIWHGTALATRADYVRGVRYAVIQHGAAISTGITGGGCKHNWYSDANGNSHEGNALLRIPCPKGCGMMDGVDICRHCGAIIPYGKGGMKP